ncbi:MULTISPECIES: hypothetical protein [unclassified Mesorhizobium]|uniref:hypothetical protein n=1 Tax=unclassified Mesorhizobium TaxID=325217 RepID=UPI0029622B56|nr:MULTISPECIES: hypothetical protein [unclassified Mesorhizobium]
MVSRQQLVRHSEPAQRRFQIGIALGFAVVGQIAGEDAERRISMPSIDMIYAAIEPLVQIRAIAYLAPTIEMERR